MSSKAPVPRQLGHTQVSQRKKRVFLRILMENGGRVHDAALAAGYKSSAPLRAYRHRDPEFAKAWDEALEAANDVLEAEAIRRGVDGVREPIYYRGTLVGYKLVYSDRMLELLLKGNNPEKFNRNSQTDININAKVGIAVIPATVKSEEEWERSAAMVHKAQKPIEFQDAEYEELPPDTAPSDNREMSRS